MKKIIVILLFSISGFADSTIDKIDVKIKLIEKQQEQISRQIEQLTQNFLRLDGAKQILEQLKIELQDSTNE